MNLFLKMDISIFSVLLLIVLYITVKNRNSVMGTSIRLYSRLLLGVICLLLLEMLSWTYDGIPGMNKWNYFLNFIFALSTSSITCLLGSYLDYQIFASYEKLKSKCFYIQPFLLTLLLLIINLFKPFIFSVNAENIYSREPFMILLPMINISVFIYICWLAYLNRKTVKREVLSVILLYVFIPALVAFLQVELLGIFILWPVMAMMVVLTYIFLETVSTSQDYLTGLVSRHRVDKYLEYMIDKKKPFILVMIDLNGFKEINDTYGHIEGDIALKVFSKSLKHHFSREKVIGRYAGDEFILILSKENIENTEMRLDKIREEMDSFYDNGDMDFRISFSHGFFEYEGIEKISYEEAVNIADNEMYKQKKKKYI